MILKKNNQANYSEIIQKIDHLSRILNRDRLKFLFYGYPESKLDLFEKKISHLKLFPADAHYKRKQANKTTKKEEIKQLLVAQYSRVYIELMSVAKSKQFDDPLTMTDKQLLHASCSILEAFNQLKIDAHSSACTLKNKASFETLVAQFEEVVFEQTEATLLRIHKSIERSKLLDDIFDDCTEISKQGQYIWNSINLKNHEDYKSFEIANQSNKIAVNEL
jgi:hypothetical protein